MSAANIILIFIGVIGLLIAFGSFIIALLPFSIRETGNRKCLSGQHTKRGSGHMTI